MDGSRRQNKVAELIKDVVSSLVIKGFRDPRIQGLITVTRVQVTADLKLARVYLSILAPDSTGKDNATEECFNGLKQAIGYMKSEVANHLKLRFTPDLELKLDPSLGYAQKISDLLKGNHD